MHCLAGKPVRKVGPRTERALGNQPVVELPRFLTHQPADTLGVRS